MELYETAERQAGYFSARQARQLGFSKALLSHHVRSGRLLRLRRGVYRLARFPEMPYADLFIAWLAAGEKAVLSHESALLLYGLTDLLPAEIHLTVPRTASRRLPGVRFHTARLNPEEITSREGLPVTTLPRTMTDLIRSGVAEEWVQQAIHQALSRGLVSEATLEEEARRRGGRVSALLGRALEEYYAL
ncbi:MAG: type IV toxin-antitoxin system AbiEi family antitoxin domain-containing protein [Bacillota bacterium]